jgi:hypothetical protein
MSSGHVSDIVNPPLMTHKRHRPRLETFPSPATSARPACSDVVRCGQEYWVMVRFRGDKPPRPAKSPSR